MNVVIIPGQPRVTRLVRTHGISPVLVVLGWLLLLLLDVDVAGRGLRGLQAGPHADCGHGYGSLGGKWNGRNYGSLYGGGRGRRRGRRGGRRGGTGSRQLSPRPQNDIAPLPFVARRGHFCAMASLDDAPFVAIQAGRSVASFLLGGAAEAKEESYRRRPARTKWATSGGGSATRRKLSCILGPSLS